MKHVFLIKRTTLEVEIFYSQKILSDNEIGLKKNTNCHWRSKIEKTIYYCIMT